MQCKWTVQCGRMNSKVNAAGQQPTAKCALNPCSESVEALLKCAVLECLPRRNDILSTQVDPFGHSATQASLLSGLLGFDSLFFGRADYQVRF